MFFSKKLNSCSTQSTMGSNFYYDGQNGQSGNMLSCHMRGLSIGASNNNHANDQSIGCGYGLNFTRMAGTNMESATQNHLRSQMQRVSGLPDFVSTQFSPNSRPFVVPNASSGSRANPAFSDDIRRSSDRLLWQSALEGDSTSLGFINSNNSRTTSRILSHMRELTPSTNESSEAYDNGSISSDAYTSFMFNRYGNGNSNTQVSTTLSSNGDNFFRGLHVSDHVNDITPVTTSSLDDLFPFGNSTTPCVLPLDTGRTTHPQITDVSMAGVPISTTVSSLGLPLGPKLSQVQPVTSSTTSSSTQYYANRNFEKTRDLQASGVLKEAPWILVPPVPETTGIHMRTGRVHEFKSRVSNDRVFSTAAMDHELKQALHNKIQACLFTSDEAVTQKIPLNVGPYTDLVPLEVMHQPQISVTFDLPSVCFKAWSPRFNRTVLLRRVILPNAYEAVLSRESYYLAKMLSEQDHPAVVGFRDIFFTDLFGDNSVIFVYEYIPCSSTLQQVHMSDPMKVTSFSSPFNINRSVRPHSSVKNGLSDLGMLPEATVCSYIVQLVHGIRYIHQNLHRFCGVLDPSKILFQDGARLRINCFGLREVLFSRGHDASLTEAMANDFVHLGKLMLGVVCGTAEAMQASQRATSFNLLQRAYRPELVNVIRSLISGQVTSIDQLMRATSSFVYTQLDHVTENSDFMERQLLSAVESDRLFRLVCKLQAIVERNDRLNPEWSETGDRYMLKLFRDFVFHQIDHLGAPHVDLTHVCSCLNKLEAGSPERLCLVSRDVDNIIITSYAEVKQWLDDSFATLVERQRQSRCDMAVQRLARAQKPQVGLPANSDVAVDVIEPVTTVLEK